MERLIGRVAVISGAGGGIGAATARIFCAEGAKVLLIDRDPAALEDKTGTLRRLSAAFEVETYVADIAAETEAGAAIAKAIERFGAVDVLVNNAAIRIPGMVETTPRSEWDRILSVNLLGAVNLYRAAAAALRNSGKASIVNVSSVYAVTGRNGMGPYDATKAALIALTRTLACEEAGHGIRVNAVCPGSTLTDYHLRRGAAKGLSEQTMQNEVRTDSLFRRWARPEEIAYPILWLASDEASFVAGAVLMVDGGLSIM
jgi:meso-butanediol dehydrogenase/(S,S)-butanediol dehydrogenase/diacetyl reductase